MENKATQYNMKLKAVKFNFTFNTFFSPQPIKPSRLRAKYRPFLCCCGCETDFNCECCLVFKTFICLCFIIAYKTLAVLKAHRTSIFDDILQLVLKKFPANYAV